MHNRIFILVSILTLSLLGGWWYVYSTKTPAPIDGTVEMSTSTPVTTMSTSSTSEISKHGECLEEGERVEYQLIKKDSKEDSAIIMFRDQISESKFNFLVPISSATHYHPIELHRCGVYARRTFGYDFQKKILLADYREELWKYNFNGIGSSIIKDESRLSTENILGDFRIDPTEKYLVLRKGYLGSPDFAIIIKDIHTLKDVFTLPLTEIEKQNPNLVGDIGFIESSDNAWSSDGRYFWADLADGANELGFIRIDSTDWSHKLLPAPPDVLGGDALNLDTGDITVHPGHIWFGDKEAYEEDRASRRAKGIGTELYIENLFTHKRTLVATSTEPNAYFKPKWFSSTTLEYFMPTVEGDKGERRTWVVQ